jgi:hypothetical protein
MSGPEDALDEEYPRGMSAPPRWPRAVFALAMIVGTLAVALFVYILWVVSHFD